ncbi:MAG: hypothetical protein HY986_10540 [Candidatus Melainabacteria bacterium]|nr:hypothetical protein [Candidatus Melainabacteria bacterium]
MSLLPENYFNAISVVGPNDPAEGGWYGFKTGFFWGVKSDDGWMIYLISALAAFLNGETRAEVIYTSRPSPVDGSTQHRLGSSFIEDADAGVGILELGMFSKETFSGEFYRSTETEFVPIKQTRHHWEGRLILTPGYPEQKALFDPNYPLVRGGIIARIGDLMDGLNSWMFIDCNVFSNHVGAPVFLQPWPIQGGERTLHVPWLLGVVTGYLDVRHDYEGDPVIESGSLAVVCPFNRLATKLPNVEIKTSTEQKDNFEKK